MDAAAEIRSRPGASSFHRKNGKLVVVNDDTGPAERVVEILRGAGVEAEALIETAEALQEALADFVLEERVRAWGEILAALEGTAAGVALRRVLTGGPWRSGREASRVAGVSHTALRKMETRIAKRLRSGVGVSKIEGSSEG